MSTTIPFSSILLGDRAREDYTGIESLADSILDGGLIQPIIIDSAGNLLCGGRRYKAIELLIERGDLPPVLHYGITSDPTRPGYLIRTPLDGTPEITLLESLQIELKENLDRINMPWQKELKLFVDCYKLAQAEAFDRDENLLARDYGAMLGVGYQLPSAGLRIWDDLKKNPTKYKDCSNLSQAYTVYLKLLSVDLAKLAATRTLAAPAFLQPAAPASALPSVPADRLPEREKGNEATLESTPTITVVAEATAQDVVIPLTSSFFNENGLDFMARQNPGFCNHIVCDPDYAVDSDVIDSGPNNRIGEMASGIVQRTRFDSLADLTRFFPLAFRAIAPGGFLVMWYSLSCHNLICGEDIFSPCSLDSSGRPIGPHIGPDTDGQPVHGRWSFAPGLAELAGFRVQQWPLIWSKMDYRGRSNAQPDRNFPKSVEYAAVFRKPDATLTQVQTSCLYSQPAASVVKELGHPFAKPYEVWRWIYRAIAIKNQVVFDPFVGRGSSAIAAIQSGLKPIGCELQADHFVNLMINLQVKYKEILGNHVTFQ